MAEKKSKNQNLKIEKLQTDSTGKRKRLKRKFRDYENHFFAFLIDVNVCLLPIYIWIVLFLLIMTGMISPFFFDLLLYLMYGFLFVICVVVMPFLCATWKGQTLGGRIVGLQLVQRNLKNANPIILVFRQILGMGLPIMIFGYFFSIPGLLAYWALNGLVVLISPNQQSIFDWVFGLVPVYAKKKSEMVIDKQEVSTIAKQEQKEQKKKPQPQVQPIQQPVVQKPAKKERELPKRSPEPKKQVVHENLKVIPIDLHVRSNFSDDASKDVEALMQEAKQKGVSTISITDHNCARANGPAKSFADYYGISYVDGVEIDAQIGRSRVRILGYYIDWKDPWFNEIEQNSLKREKDASLKRAQKFMDATGVKINLKAIMEKSRFQILSPKDLTDMVFINKKTREKPFVRKYLSMYQDERMARKAFEEDYFGAGGPCEVELDYPIASEVIDRIHANGGMAVLANWKLDSLGDELLNDLLGMGLDGLEVFTPKSGLAATAFLLKVAQQEGLLITAGSDYHGDDEPNRQLGEIPIPENGLPLIDIFAAEAKKRKDTHFNSISPTPLSAMDQNNNPNT